MRITLATDKDVARLTRLHNAVADALTSRYGQGHWSGQATERGTRFGLTHKGHAVVAKEGRRILGVLRLQTRKPWAIDVGYFTPVKTAMYLVGMAVLPDQQGQGLGRALMDEAARLAKAWPANAIRLDAYDADAGAGDFYLKCGYREVGRVKYKGTPLRYFELLLD